MAKPAIIGIDHIDDLVSSSIVNLNKSYSKPLSDGEIKVVVGDGRLGLPSEAPFDVINVAAGCMQVPMALVE